MLEVLYDTATLRVLSWNADKASIGHYAPAPGNAVVILPIDPPDYLSDAFVVDLVSQAIYGAPQELDPDYIRAAEILATSPAVISMPEIWEFLRIIGKRLGFYVPD